MKTGIVLFAALLFTTACAPTTKQTTAAQSHGSIFNKLDVTQLRSCSLNDPCPSGEGCTSYGGSGAYCYAEGHENEVAGCTSGQMIIMDSEPGQAACL